MTRHGPDPVVDRAGHLEADPARCRDLAVRIERQHPGWLLMWSPYFREFYAFPCFMVPRGTVLHYREPDELVPEMLRVQKAAAQAARAVAGAAGGGMWA